MPAKLAAALAAAALAAPMGGCSSMLEDRFAECRPMVDERQAEARREGRYSYSGKGYGDCMRPTYIHLLFNPDDE